MLGSPPGLQHRGMTTIDQIRASIDQVRASAAGTFAKRLVGQVLDDDVPGLAAELAYRFFLALFPFAMFVAGLGGFIARQLGVGYPASQATDQLTGALPPEAATLLGRELDRVVSNHSAGLLSIGLLAAAFFATGGTNALIKAMNRAFDVEETRPFLRKYLLALGLTVLAGASIVAAFVLLVVGQVAGTEIARQLGLGGAAAAAISVVRWALTIVFLVMAVLVLYRLGPNVRLDLRAVLPGAVTFVAGWIVATLAFGVYVANFGSYGATFGALAGVAILMIWFYLTAFILLLGVEINDLLRDWRT